VVLELDGRGSSKLPNTVTTDHFFRNTIPSKFVGGPLGRRSPMDIPNCEDATSALNLFKVTTIQSGHTVLLRLPSGETKGFKVEKDA
jgi:hypothetical protein